MSQNIEPPIVEFVGYQCNLLVDRCEQSGRLILVLVTIENGDMIGRAAVSLPEFPLGDEDLIFKCESGVQAFNIVRALERAGLVKRTGKEIKSGMLMVPVVTMTEKMKRIVGNAGFEIFTPPKVGGGPAPASRHLMGVK